MKSQTIGANLSAAVTEIRSYPHVTFKHVPKLRVGDALLLGDHEDIEEEAVAGGAPLKPHTWSKRVKQYEGTPLLIRSDGGFIGGVGTIGFVVYDVGGG